MDKNKRAILYGLVIGDGNLYLTKNNFGIEYCKLTIGHSPKQREYLEHKIDIIHSLLGGKRPKVYSYKSRGYTNLQTVKTNTYFKQIHRNLYPTGVKKYTRKVLDFLNDQALAIWYMDDGSGTVCKNKKGKISGCMTRLSTYCSEKEAIIIREWFEDKYGISPKFDIDKRNNKYSMRFNTQESKIFIDVISKYVPDCMKYKTEHVKNIIQECSTPL